MSSPITHPPRSCAHPQNDPHEEGDSAKSANVIQVFSPLSSAPVIAVDMDDVLCQTNHCIAEWHNSVFGTDMDISMFYYYYYWKNPHWGTPSETMAKVAAFYKTDLIRLVRPVPGALEGIRALKQMGFRLAVVTARGMNIQALSWQWLNEHFPGMFETIVCTGQFKDGLKKEHKSVTKLHKAQVCREINARLLIDDALENAFSVATAADPTPVLLFGKYEWNTRLSEAGDIDERMTFDIRLKTEGGREFWRDETIDLPQHLPLWRVEDWEKVVVWLENEGRKHLFNE